MARCELHGKVARWLSGLTGSRANDFLGITAEHYERAGDVASAAEFHARGVDYALERFAHAAVLDHVHRALTLLDNKSDDALLHCAGACWSRVSRRAPG